MLPLMLLACLHAPRLRQVCMRSIGVLGYVLAEDMRRVMEGSLSRMGRLVTTSSDSLERIYMDHVLIWERR
jgi:hypothetical protein